MQKKIDIFDQARFLCVACVVMLHTYCGMILHAQPPTAGWVYYAQQCFVWATHVSLATLFFISGYLFFRYVDKWSWHAYGSKLKRRVLTLLMPFMVWNILAILARLVSYAMQGHGADAAGLFAEYGGWRIFWDGDSDFYSPILIVSWFLRDLMLFGLAAPVAYLLGRYCPRISFAAMLLCFVSGMWPTEYICAGQHVIAYFLGCAVALKGDGMERVLHEKRIVPKAWAESSMFVYLAHTLYVLPVVAWVVRKAVPFSGMCFSLLRYMIMPTLAIALLVAAYQLLKRYAPYLLFILTGRKHDS